MDDRYLTEQERIDNMTMKIENESVLGSGFIQHPPQQRKAQPPNLRDHRAGYDRGRNNYYGGDDRYYSYRPRQRQFRPRPYPQHQNAYRPSFNDPRSGYYRGQSFPDQMRHSPRMGQMVGRRPRFEPRSYGPPRNRPDWDHFHRQPSGSGRFMPRMRPPNRPNDYRMAHQMQGYVPCYPTPTQQHQSRPAGMQDHGQPSYPGPPNENQADPEHSPQDPPPPREETAVQPTGDAKKEEADEAEEVKQN